MQIRISSLLILLGVSYILGIFLAPKQFDEIAKLVGIFEFNQMLRDGKVKLESLTGEYVHLNEKSGGLMLNTTNKNLNWARDIVSEAQSKMETTKSQIENAKSTIEIKVDQGKQIYESANSLKTQIDTFTTLSGSTTPTRITNSGSRTSSGAASRTSSGTSTLPPISTP